MTADERGTSVRSMTLGKPIRDTITSGAERDAPDAVSRACGCARLLVGVMAKRKGRDRLPQQRADGAASGCRLRHQTLIHDDD
jgi:hypothetical protein